MRRLCRDLEAGWTEGGGHRRADWRGFQEATHFHSHRSRCRVVLRCTESPAAVKSSVPSSRDHRREPPLIIHRRWGNCARGRSSCSGSERSSIVSAAGDDSYVRVTYERKNSKFECDDARVAGKDIKLWHKPPADDARAATNSSGCSTVVTDCSAPPSQNKSDLPLRPAGRPTVAVGRSWRRRCGTGPSQSRGTSRSRFIAFPRV